MLTWGLDLQVYKADRERRNLASYLPNDFDLGVGAVRAEGVKELAIDLASLIEPNAGGTFPVLDLYLVATALSTVSNPAGPPAMASEMETVAAAVLPAGAPVDQAGKDLATAASNAPALISAATAAFAVNHPAGFSDVEGIIGRALILSRLATGGIVDLQRSAGVSLSDLVPWADSLGPRLGFWDPAPRPASLVELWLDIFEGVDALSSGHPTGPASLQTLLQTSGDAITSICGLSRASLWSVSA